MVLDIGDYTHQLYVDQGAEKAAVILLPFVLFP